MARRLALVVTGDRNADTYGDVAWTWRGLIRDHFLLLFRRYDRIVLLHGACGEDAERGGETRGIDGLVHELGVQFKPIVLVPVPADWIRGRSAGPRRNGDMLEIQRLLGLHGYDKLTHGYHDDLPASKGTGGCIAESRKLGAETHAFRSDGSEWDV